MAQHVHFDLDQAEREVRAAFADTVAQALNEIEAQNLGPDATAFVDCQRRASEVRVAMVRWYLSEVNSGTPPDRIFAAAGQSLGFMVAEFVGNATRLGVESLFLGHFDHAVSGDPSDVVGVEPRSLHGMQGGRA